MERFDFSQWRENTKPYDRRMPFHRVNVPRAHVIRVDREGDDPGYPIEMPDGRGYDCGCRSPEDYDRKIGKEIGDELGKLSNAIPGYGALSMMAGGFAKLLKQGQAIPLLGPLFKRVGDAIDEWHDPLRKLVKEFGGLIDALLVDSMMRGVPSWVYPYRALPGSKRPSEHEVDGILVASRLRADSLPFTQWHHWYDWTFQVDPSPPFMLLVGRGNRDRSAAEDRWWVEHGEKPKLVRYDAEWGGHQGGASANWTLECELDMGAIGQEVLPDTFEDERDGYEVMPFQNKVAGGGAVGWKRDWGWPQAGQFFWATGWPAYDCSHATDDKKEEGLHLNQLHPIKAWASARWEAHRFRETSQPVPAIQFSFFACDHRSSGGDIEWPGLNDCDYEFVVDLPPAPAPPTTPYAIGPTPPFERTTLVLRPRLLLEVVDGRFDNALKPFPLGVELRPRVELLPHTDPAKPQARVVVPLSKLPKQEGGTEQRAFRSYGLSLAMGWLDADPAAKLWDVSVQLAKLELHKDAIFYQQPSDDPKTLPDWVLNVAINGRWSGTRFKPHIKPHTWPFFWPEWTTQGLPFEMFKTTLAADDPVLISCHGFRERGLGQLYKKPERVKTRGDDHDDEGDDLPPNLTVAALTAELEKLDRIRMRDRRLRLHKTYTLPAKPGEKPTTVTLPFIGRTVKWWKDVFPAKDPEEAKRVGSSVVRAMFLRLAVEEGLQANLPLGVIDPLVADPAHQTLHRGRVNDGKDAPNPLTPRQVLAAVGERTWMECQLTAYRTEPYGRMGSLAYDPTLIDYVLHFRIRVDPVPPPAKAEGA